MIYARARERERHSSEITMLGSTCWKLSGLPNDSNNILYMCIFFEYVVVAVVTTAY